MDSNGQINFTSGTDISGSSYVHQGPGGAGHTADTSALFLPAAAQISVPPGEHGQLLLQGGQLLQQHGQLQPELPGVVQCPGGILECVETNTMPTSNLTTGGTPGKKTKHGTAVGGKNKKLQQQVVHPQVN